MNDNGSLAEENKGRLDEVGARFDRAGKAYGEHTRQIEALKQQIDSLRDWVQTLQHHQDEYLREIKRLRTVLGRPMEELMWTPGRVDRLEGVVNELKARATEKEI